MSFTQTSQPVGTIYLRPRPYARGSGVLVLVPLNSSYRKPPPTLPAETWFRIFTFIFATPSAEIDVGEAKARAGLLRVSRSFKNIISPLFYSYAYFPSQESLKAFSAHLRESDRKWDSIRRIPYSTPGRWVQALDLSMLTCMSPRERLTVDTWLTQLFPITPFLSRLILNNSIKMSTRVLTSLASREGVHFLRVLKGLKWEELPPYYLPREDPLLSLLYACEGLEVLEITGPGLQDEDDDIPQVQLTTPPPTPLPPISLPNLQSLKLLLMPKGPILESLVRSSLPSLRRLLITPYDDVETALTSSFVSNHSAKLSTLEFHTPKVWPSERHTSPTDILENAPHLRALSLTLPLPQLSPPSLVHPLQVLYIPRPSSTYLWKVEAWLYLGLLPYLEEVHMREVTWIRAGVSNRAVHTGVQGDMQEWRKRLTRYKVRVLDNHGREYDG
ncbi:hypothetical protein M422DRAFT_25107 [Sphaerobolus stellatus SS14]|nr:hypothetical protein M422DRAFT_25107 [Sphaerobolus stellatus SS14]